MRLTINHADGYEELYFGDKPIVLCRFDDNRVSLVVCPGTNWSDNKGKAGVIQHSDTYRFKHDKLEMHCTSSVSLPGGTYTSDAPITMTINNRKLMLTCCGNTTHIDSDGKKTTAVYRQRVRVTDGITVTIN